MKGRNPADRLADYKKTTDADDGRRRREDTRLQIRREKKEERMLKRRMGTNMPQLVEETPAAPITSTVADLPQCMGVINNNASTVEELAIAVKRVRKMLSVMNQPPVEAVINSGVLPHLVRFLAVPNRDLQFEAAWALTNIASTDFTGTVVDAFAVPALASLLRSEHCEVREQAAWCLGNIAGDCIEYRDLVLNTGASESMILNIQNPANESLLGNVVWAISNLCRGKPQPALPIVGRFIPDLCGLLHTNCSDDAKVDALWALSYITDGDNVRIEAVVNQGITPKLVEILQGGAIRFTSPALRILGNFATGTESQTQAVIDAGVLEIAAELLDHSKKGVRKESCWLLSNVAAGTHKQISTLFKHPRILRKLVETSMDAQWDIRKEAIWAVSNICTGGTDSHVELIVEYDAIEAMCNVFEVSSETRMLMVALDALESILTVGQRHERPYTRFVDECGGIDQLEQLQQHSDQGIYDKVIKLIDRFFGEEEAEDENLMPSNNGETFGFGLSPTKNLFGSSSFSMQEASMSPMGTTYNFNNAFEAM